MKVGVHFSHFMAILSHFGIIIFYMTHIPMRTHWCIYYAEYSKFITMQGGAITFCMQKFLTGLAGLVFFFFFFLSIYKVGL